MQINNLNIKIEAIAAAVSNNWDSILDKYDTPEDIEQIKRFSKKIGVKGRYLAGEKQTASDFCVCAAEQILSEKNISRDEIGVIVYVTQSGDYRDPSGAAVIQHRLGISQDCIAFDVNLGCSGFVCGLSICGSLLNCSNSKYGMLLCGETAARERDPANPRFFGHADTVLFGDAGTATLISKSENDVINVYAKTDGNRFRSIIVPYGFYRNPSYPQEVKGDVFMDEIEVFNFSTKEAPELIMNYMNDYNKKPDYYDYIVLHQANKFIMDRIVKLSGFKNEQSLVSIDRFGNTSSASIPLTLVDSFGDNDDKRSIKALCCGYGVGLSWAVTELKVNLKDVLPLTHTDSYFEDGF